jgi:hypothetical protein
MNLYPENYEVALPYPFQDLNGQPVTPELVMADLYDGDERLVHSFGTLSFQPGDTSIEVTIAGEFNVLGAGELNAARILRVVLVTDAGDIEMSQSYGVIGAKRIQVMNNSFTTLEAAELAARDMPNLAGWASATDDQKYAALIDAYAKISRMTMRYTTYATNDLGRRCPNQTIVKWGDITLDQFNAMPAEFRKALRMAQIYQADESIENDPILARQRAGIISETIGESSVMLRGGQLSLDIASKASAALKGYIYYNFRIARA